MSKTEAMKDYRLSKLAVQSLSLLVGNTQEEILSASNRALEAIESANNRPLLTLEQLTLCDVGNLSDRYEEVEKAGVKFIGAPTGMGPGQTPLELAGFKFPEFTIKVDESLAEGFNNVNKVLSVANYSQIPVGELISARIVAEVLCNSDISVRVPERCIPPIAWRQKGSKVWNITRTYLKRIHFTHKFSDILPYYGIGCPRGLTTIRYTTVTSDGSGWFKIQNGMLDSSRKIYHCLLTADMDYKLQYRQGFSDNLRIGFREAKEELLEASTELELSKEED